MGDLKPLSEDLDSRKEEVANSKPRLKIVVLNSHPDELTRNLRKQGHKNLLQTFVPMKIRFPKIKNDRVDEKTTLMLRKLIVNLRQIGYLNVNQAGLLFRILKSKYGIPLKEKDFPWKI